MSAIPWGLRPTTRRFKPHAATRLVNGDLENACVATRSTNSRVRSSTRSLIDQQVAADEQHRVGTVEIEHLLDAFEAHTAGRNGQRRRSVPHGARMSGGKRGARCVRVAEPSADVDEDHGIGPVQPQQAAEQQFGRDLRARRQTTDARDRRSPGTLRSVRRTPASRPASARPAPRARLLPAQCAHVRAARAACR